MTINSIYTAFEVKGNSMNDGTPDAYLDKDRLICRELKLEYADEEITIGGDYVIRIDGSTLFNRVVAFDGQELVLHSLNSAYEDMRLNLCEVKELYEVWHLQRKKINFKLKM